MLFTPAQLSYRDLPIAYVLELGGEEFLGLRDDNGDFQQIDSIYKVPAADWQPVATFGPSLGLLLPCHAAILVNDQPVGQMDINVVNGRPGCVAISANGHGLTGSLLRQIPIASLVRDAAIANTVRVLSVDGEVFGARYVDGGLGFGQLLADLRQELAVVEEQSHRRVVNDAFLQRVAEIYRDALAGGEPPANVLQELLGPTTPQNARRWVGQARKEGFLRPAPREGVAGEID